jgi:hypothetical protein
MQYLLMCCIDERLWAGTPASQRDGVMQDYGKLIQGLVENGKYLSGAKLRGSDAATTVRERNGKPVITDGPFAETREQLGGYHVVECRDLDEAIAIAQRIPTLRVGGTVEVRPLDHATA